MNNEKRLSADAVKIIVGLIILVTGMVLWFVPGADMVIIVWVIGIIMLAYGVIATIVVVRKKDGSKPVLPIVCAVFGALLLVFCTFIGHTVLPFVIGAWMIVMGVLDLLGAQKTEGNLRKILGIASLVLGIIVLICLFAVKDTQATAAIICMLVFGVVAIVDFFAVRKTTK